MDNDLMDRWAACVFGVDCETHRGALDEIQQLREELGHELRTGLCEEEVADLRAEFQNERDTLQGQLEAERARSADLARRLDAIQDVILEKAT